MAEQQTSARRFGFIAEHRPEWAKAFGGLFRTSYEPPEPSLDRRTRILIYLSALASVGAVDGFRTHLADAEAEGVAREEILEAILLTVPAVGYPRVFEVVETLSDYPVKTSG